MLKSIKCLLLYHEETDSGNVQVRPKCKYIILDNKVGAGVSNWEFVDMAAKPNFLVSGFKYHFL